MASQRSTAVVFERELIDSSAFADLSGMAVKMLMIFYRKRQVRKVEHPKRERWDVLNNGKIEFSYKEGAGMGINSKVFRSRLLELEAHGFIRQNSRGGGQERDLATYYVTADWRCWKLKPTSPRAAMQGGIT